MIFQTANSFLNPAIVIGMQTALKRATIDYLPAGFTRRFSRLNKNNLTR